MSPTRLADLCGGYADGFAPAEEGVRGVGEFRGGDFVLNRQRQFVNDLGGVWRNDSGANQDAFLVGDQLHEAIAEVAGVTAGDDIERCGGLFDAQVALQAVVFGQPDRGDAGVGKGQARSCGVIRGDAVFRVHDVVGGDAAFEECGVRMARVAENVTGREDMPGAGLELRVHLDTLRRVGDRGVFEAEVDTRDATGRDQDVNDANRLLDAPA